MDNTFWQDFTIADRFGEEAVRDTFDRAFKEWRSNYKMLTELVIVLNHKVWQHYENNNKRYMELYKQLWGDCDEWAYTNLKGEELTYYYNTTD